MKTALITGIAGFAGSHLAEYLLSKNIDVFGFYHPSHPTENVKHIQGKIQLIATDILSGKKVENEIKAINPDYIFHLAAFSSPAQSFINPRETLENNIFGEFNILQAASKFKLKTKILIIGSADEYGNVDEKFLPIAEDAPLMPISPYAVSKVTQDILGLQFFLNNKLNIVRVRPFNHIGPRQSTNFVVPSFASQIAKIEKDGEGIIKVGNLESFRDFADVRDMVKAYFLSLEKGRPGKVYNIGSGKPVKISQILKKLISFSSAKIEVKVDKSRYLPIDIEKIFCDYSKFHKDTGWQPTISLAKTLFDTLEYERSKIR